MSIGLVAEHINHLADDVIYINRLQTYRTLSVKRADTVDDVGCAYGVAGHLRSSLACLGHIGLIAVEKSQARLGICNGRPNWLVHFVRQGSCQLSHSADSVQMCNVA